MDDALFIAVDLGAGSGRVFLAIAAKRFPSLAAARRHVAQNTRVKTFTLSPSPALAEAMRRYSQIEMRYVN
jgi:hypothetical protein